MTEGLQPLYPITPFLSPPRIYAQGLNPNLSLLGLNTDPFSALEKMQKHRRCNFLFLLNISEIYRIPS